MDLIENNNKTYYNGSIWMSNSCGEFAGKQIVKIDKWFPSSKTCSVCGKVKKDLKLSDRIYTCECGFEIDRDLNASINIKNEGSKLLAY